VRNRSHAEPGRGRRGRRGCLARSGFRAETEPGRRSRRGCRIHPYGDLCPAGDAAATVRIRIPHLAAILRSAHPIGRVSRITVPIIFSSKPAWPRL